MARLARWALAPRSAWQIVLCAVVLCLPTLALGLHSDDYHLAANVQRDAFDAFRFERATPEALERRAWWLPTGYLRFFRPLSSATHWLDFNLWPRGVVIMRLQSIAWYALLVLAACALHARVLRQPGVASLAGLLYAINGPHALAVGWLASRNTVIATLFGAVALLLHVRGRDGHRPSAWLAPGALALSLLSAEFGISTLAYLVAYELVLGKGSRLARGLRLLPYAAIVTGWWSLYVAGGHGVRDSVWYYNLGEDPLGATWAALSNLPIYLAGQLYFPPFIALAGLLPPARLPVLALSLGLLVWLGRLMWPAIRRHETARFYALGALLSVLPLATTRAQDRLLPFVALGLSGVVALWLHGEAGPDAWQSASRSYRRLLRNYLFGRPVLFLLYPFALALMLGSGERALEAALPLDPAKGVVLLNPPGTFMTEQPALIRRHLGKPFPRYAYVLYAGRGAVDVERIAAGTLELRAAQGWPATGESERVRHRFRAGERRRRPHMTAEVVQVTAAGVPTVVRFHFAEPFERAEPLLLAFRGLESTPAPIPALGDRGYRVAGRRSGFLP